MDEFIEQFLVEAREIVEQATSDLISLEIQPTDTERLDSLFRAFHTLKGSAGIVDFTAMSEAVHVVEDHLSQVRSSNEPFSQALIEQCLFCLEIVRQWLDQMQATGALPTGADKDAAKIVSRMSTLVAPPRAQTNDQAWRSQFVTRFGQESRNGRTAILIEPKSDCFFAGIDPLASAQNIPDILALDFWFPHGTPGLGEFKPFISQLAIAVLTTLSGNEVRAHVRFDWARVTVLALDQDAGSPESGGAILREQIRLLREPFGEGWSGRFASAARVASNTFKVLGRPDDARAVSAFHSPAPAAAASSALANLLERILSKAPAENNLEATATPVGRSEAAIQTLRVPVARIDHLLRLSGEIAAVSSGLKYLAAGENGSTKDSVSTDLKDCQVRLDRLTKTLQRAVLQIRVLPLGHIFQRFPRLIREMGQTTGKAVTFVTEGDDVEADKAIVEALFEPILHVIRNAVDHGLENAEMRRLAGKLAPPEVRLRAAPVGGKVLIEIIDNGQGINTTRVLETAVRRGLIESEAAQVMSDDEIARLIFLPGFSTSHAVTSLSGRGVGMDAVRSAVERLGGQVEIESRAGVGTTIRLILPFSVVMTSVLTVESGGQMFGLPLDNVVETARTPRTLIHPVGAGRALVLRGQTLNVSDLTGLLGNQPAMATHAAATIVVLRIAGELTGVEVDKVGEKLDVMLTPAEGLLSGVEGISGTTVTGDGRVLIVLDVEALLR